MRRVLAVSIAISIPLLALAAPPDGMVLVPTGPFRMGADLVEDEKPVHTVEVAAFHMDRHEVTNGEFARFIDRKGYTTEALWSEAGWAWRTENEISSPRDWEIRRKDLGEAFGRHPVVGVSFHEAEAYARFARKRLPTEVEWEKAARGALGQDYPWGEKAEDGGPAGAAKTHTHEVGENPKDRSPYGVMDLGGNVAEWTSSWFAAYPGSKHESKHHGEKYRVIRGGSWRFEVATKRRGAWRGYWRYGKPGGRPDGRAPFIGIRLVSDVKPER